MIFRLGLAINQFCSILLAIYLTTLVVDCSVDANGDKSLLVWLAFVIVLMSLFSMLQYWIWLWNFNRKNQTL